MDRNDGEQYGRSLGLHRCGNSCGRPNAVVFQLAARPPVRPGCGNGNHFTGVGAVPREIWSAAV